MWHGRKVLSNMKKIILGLLIWPFIAVADGGSVDKVYHPYVQPLETEIEWRVLSVGNEQLYRLGIGQALSDNVFIEAYYITNKGHAVAEKEVYELELKWQLTEQGEYEVDWGVLFELEKVQHEGVWELSTALLMEKEWGKWVTAVNTHLIVEWGSDIETEIETSLAIQAKYRYAAHFEPAIEFYSAESGQAIGPVVMGDIRLGQAKKLHWEIGSIFGLGYKGPDNTWRFLMEYEF